MTGNGYFETPERAERAQLLIHLINNAQDVIYLRGPRGAGKTRFMQQLLPTLEPDYEITWQSGSGNASIESAPGEPSRRPLGSGDSELDLLIQSQPDLATLRVIDDADALGPAELDELRSLDPAQERIVLLGTGGPTLGLGGLPLQCVDLPAFTEAQSRAFLRAQPGGSEAVLDESLLASLHRAAGGQPGPLLDALVGLPPPKVQPAKGAKKPERPWASWNWRLIGIAGALVLLLATVLLLQDHINALFVPAEEEAQVAGDVPPDAREAPSEPDDAALAEQGLPSGAASDLQATPPPGEDFQTAVYPTPPVTAKPAESPEPAPIETIDAGQEPPSDPILDAVIDAAIQAAEQPPQAPAEGAGAAEQVPAATAGDRAVLPSPREVAKAAPAEPVAVSGLLLRPERRPVSPPAVPGWGG